VVQPCTNVALQGRQATQHNTDESAPGGDKHGAAAGNRVAAGGQLHATVAAGKLLVVLAIQHGLPGVCERHIPVQAQTLRKRLQINHPVLWGLRCVGVCVVHGGLTTPSHPCLPSTNRPNTGHHTSHVHVCFDHATAALRVL
jgi:hypothetical protein